jgi:DNA helicase INO80
VENAAQFPLSQSLALDGYTDTEFYARCVLSTIQSLPVNTNCLAELWALLHFIMPSLFDSHDEFNEWFSKDIENAAENKGSKLNEHQLRRLHMILRPFMLRRVKRNVQNELSDKVHYQLLCTIISLVLTSTKIEKDIYVDLSARQRTMYKALQANVSVADLLEKAANLGDADSARSLMNLVMQFRKVRCWCIAGRDSSKLICFEVCNHPELFERADIVAPYSFSEFGRSGPLNRQGDFVIAPYSTRSPIKYSIPELLYLDGGLRDVPYDGPGVAMQPDQGVLHKLMNIWTTDWIQHSIMNEGKLLSSVCLVRCHCFFGRFPLLFPPPPQPVSRRYPQIV